MTVRLSVAVWIILPLVPRMVRAEVPRDAVDETASTRFVEQSGLQLVTERVGETPPGTPDTARDTGDAEPESRLMLICAVSVVPRGIEMALSPLTEKSNVPLGGGGGGATATVTSSLAESTESLALRRSM